ncbi:hypothetical protein ACFRI7_11830 [Streptomyces sp. NPDC056716]|uniref:hypothetical protein n=1 Tax=unclassified Streptomyces TaxID=2593676 RepID=UPI0036A37935
MPAHSPDHLDFLGLFLRQAKIIVETFDQNPAQQQEDGQPVDIDAYSWAAHRRDRLIWIAFLSIRVQVPQLLATATAQLDQLPAPSRAPWAARLRALGRAAEALDREHEDTVERLRGHFAGPGANLETADLILTEFFDEAWHPLEIWAISGHTVIELNSMVHPANAPAGSPAPAVSRRRPHTVTATERPAQGPGTPPAPGPHRAGGQRC